MWHENVAKDLSAGQRNVLIRHVNGPCQISVHASTSKPVNLLLARRLLRYSTEGGEPTAHTRARFTALTEDGRAVVGFVLGRFADELIAAGFLESGLIRLESRGVKLSLTADSYADSHDDESAEAPTEA